MPIALLGRFLALPGFVHWLDFAQNVQLFELQAGLSWPADSWALARLLGEPSRRALAGALPLLVAAGFQ